MFNIRIKGKYKNEEQLTRGKELPNGAVRFKEGETIREVFNLGFLNINLSCFAWHPVSFWVSFHLLFGI